MPMNEETPEVFEPQTDTVEIEADTAPVVEKVEIPKPKAETPKPKAKPVKASVSSEVPNGAVVSLKALDPETNAKNSTSVRWVQTRLLELGHMEAGSDLRGHFSHGTIEALAEYAVKVGIEPCCEADPAVIESLMKGTPAKVVE